MSSDEEVEKPPERRAPSSRASKGSRMQKLIAEEEEDAEEGDVEFYQQDFWAEAEGDVEYDAGAEDQGADSFDSDFGDSTESDDDDDDDEAAQKKASKKEAKIARRKGVYVDPKLKEERAAKRPAGEKKSHKRQRADSGPIEAAAFSRSSLRGSTQEKTDDLQARRELDEQRRRERERKRVASGKTKGVVELVRLTQEEILAEAKQTEIINRASLEKMLRIEEEKRKVAVRDRDTSGPRIVHRSVRRGDSVLTTVSFVECDVPDAVNGIAPPYPAPPRCTITGLPAKFCDPATGTPYATVEAFRMLRGKTGRRSTSFAGVAPGAGLAAAAAAEALQPAAGPSAA